jgi:hypothetical protein
MKTVKEPSKENSGSYLLFFWVLIRKVICFIALPGIEKRKDGL